MTTATATNQKLMNRGDVAAYYNRTGPWVDKSVRTGLLPKPIRNNGAPLWTPEMLDANMVKLAEEAANKAY